MIFIPGGTFRMGADRHYPEEAPVHRVTVDQFWIDRTPVTNRDFRRFVNENGCVTFPEINPDAKDYPGTLPHTLKAGGGPEAGSLDPRQPQIKIPRKVINGGSHLCARNYCRRYRPAAHHAEAIDTSTTHLRFRCIKRGDAK